MNSFSYAGFGLIILGGIGALIGLLRRGADAGRPVTLRTKVFSIAAPVGVFIIILGIVCLILPNTPLVSSSDPHPSTPPPTSASSGQIASRAPSPSAAPTVPIVPTVKITSPIAGTPVSESQGFVVVGTVSDLGGDTIWIVDYYDGYTVDDKATLLSGGTWRASDDNLEGNGYSPPFPVTTDAIIASPACAKALDRTEKSSDNSMDNLPVGCTIADQVVLEVNRR
jgi:hypothetical protein